MTYLDAALSILTQAGQPLHYAEITRRALEQDLIQPSGLTPDATMGSRLYTETKQEGTQFVRVGRGIFGLAKQQPSGIDGQVQRINRETREQLRELLQTMPPDRFEALVMELLLQMGFDENTVNVTPYRGDGGIDVSGIYRAAGLTEVNAAVQVKRWKGNVGSPAVTQLRGSLQVHQQGIIITTSDFSKSARREANAPNKTRIGLINGDELIELLIKYEVGVQEKTLQVVGLDDEWWGELLVREAGQEVEPSLPIQTSLLSLPSSDEQSPSGSPAAPTDTKTNHESLSQADVRQAASTQVLAPSKPTGRKPAAVTIFGTTHPIHSWKELLVTVCNALAARHDDTFAIQATQIKGRKRHYIAASSDGMINPAPIEGTRLWVETNLSAANIKTLAERLLQGFGHNPEDLQIEYREQFA